LEPSLHSLEVKRTAHLYQLGMASEQTKFVWLALHGYGQNPAYWVQKFAPLVDTQTVVLAPEGLSRFYLQGNSGRVGASWMTKEQRQHEIQDYLGYLEQVEAKIKHDMPRARILLLGFSQGGATAARYGVEHPSKIAALVLWSAIFPADLKAELPTSSLPIWLAYGDADPFLNGEQLESTLQRYRAMHTGLRFLPFSGAHEINAEALLQLKTEVLASLLPI
jgi:predicted esterase